MANPEKVPSTPNRDVGSSNFVPSSDRYLKVDEAVADDNDRVTSPNDPMSESVTFGFPQACRPSSSSETIDLTARVKKFGTDNVSTKLELLSGSTVLGASYSTVSGGFVNQSLSVSPAGGIPIDYNDLRARVSATVVTPIANQGCCSDAGSVNTVIYVDITSPCPWFNNRTVALVYSSTNNRWEGTVTIPTPTNRPPFLCNQSVDIVFILVCATFAHGLKFFNFSWQTVATTAICGVSSGNFATTKYTCDTLDVTYTNSLTIGSGYDCCEQCENMAATVHLHE